MGSLDGTIAVVTGASRGIGKGCALELGAAGATVYVSGRDAGTLEQSAREIDELGGSGVAAVCDQRQDEQVKQLFERVRAERGRLDVLVNSSFLDPGILNSPPFWETPISWYDDMNDIGTRSAYVATYYAVPLLLDSGGGLIANVSSMGAAFYYQHVAYGMGKAALDKLTRDASRQLRDHSVAVVSIWPYIVKTETVQKLVESGAPLPLEGAESQRFTGRGVATLAGDPDVLQRGGKSFTSRELADDYGFTDVDGSLPTGSPPPKRR
ncbi:MAG: SDR family NAD(P)-dependent oxidoreductase [Proteobacteria bacterium]|nr:SDR family NAD(P)-dependent oxidoreductase [Pseudomonadota bacterium]